MPVHTGTLGTANSLPWKCWCEIAIAFKIGYGRIEGRWCKMSHPDKRTKRRGFFFPLQQEESTHRSFLSLPLSFFSPLRFLSCRGIILCLLTPLQPQTCQHELTGWKRKKNIYPQHFCDLLHCHCGCDLSGPVTYFSSNLSVTQMMPSQQTRNSALCKFAGKRAKGKTSKDASPPMHP